MKEIDKIAFIEIQKGKILSTKSKGKTKYYIPGGKRENGESDEQTLIREIAEELSVAIIPNTAEYIGTFSAQSDGEKEGINVIMTCYKAKYSGTLKANSEIEEIKWLNYNDLDIISEVDKKIFSFLNEKGELK
ncbi:NUDIX domain-containing protein [Flavobacterium gillisiae]|jgi:8-oxo-dGTP pyrophosphatase MutT (NUDIX family)|uniref:NUDIX domain-containing protein n=1 Tax=Flavobacterium gillisiae TaxID=150146 RepID=A0A1H4D7Q4_9FLAO|nr:NUDIX domain-containing protein [Flavobacterium gillisiae]SEA68721.1 NUDIX domain-containing protein [Flavobacterium gillisiae]